MIIEEYKSESTIIKFEDKDIVTEEENRDAVNLLLTIIVKKISEYL